MLVHGGVESMFVSFTKSVYFTKTCIFLKHNLYFTITIMPVSGPIKFFLTDSKNPFIDL